MNLGTNSKLDTSLKTAGAGRNNNPVFFWLFVWFFFLGEPENFVGVLVQASGLGVSYRRRNNSRRAESPKIIPAWWQLLKAGEVKHAAQHASSPTDPHFLCIAESFPGRTGVSLLLAGNSVCPRVFVGSSHCPHVPEDECFWRITSIQFGWFPESKISTFKIYFYLYMCVYIYIVVCWCLPMWIRREYQIVRS